jgi:hypothetical protein
MKRSAVLLSAALLMVSAAAGWIESVRAESATNDAAEEIRRLERQHDAATVHGDVAALRALAVHRPESGPGPQRRFPLYAGVRAAEWTLARRSLASDPR